ncbi:MAG TPA: Na-translocating system protein MpsC family protein [Solirubrobacterales bacterium]
MSTSEVSQRQGGSSLVEFSNAMVALHREHFGRGPAAARAFIADGFAICVLTDVYTRVEQTLIEAGRLDHVRDTRLLHQESLEEEYKRAAEAVLGREVIAFLSATHTEPDVEIEVCLLGDPIDSAGSNDASEEEGSPAALAD